MARITELIARHRTLSVELWPPRTPGAAERLAASLVRLERLAPERPRHLLGIGEIDDLIAGVELGIDTFDCAMPTRLGRHGVALVPDPATRWRVDLVKARWRRSPARWGSRSRSTPTSITCCGPGS